ncbi:PREDICTED: linker for activation of T-cells family member 1 [Elephantulus edwardii]|uniref:linker for activation of T-cells family member 1 n=1 Tax=Elephantulus edwardii TaxID=28737 RepID=UPI0003F07962|nr:PREDICTED: linker for activation of T-cells family member 1 [Elephantulus edwardii]
METTVPVSTAFGLLLLPVLAVLVTALCLRCRELPGECGAAGGTGRLDAGSYNSASSDGMYPSSMQIKRPCEYEQGSASEQVCPFAEASLRLPPRSVPYTLAPWPPSSLTPVANINPPASVNPPVSSYLPLSQPDLLPVPRSPQPPGASHRTPSSRQDSDGANSIASYENEELLCEDTDEDEDDYPERYLVVLPDSVPAATPNVPPAPVPSEPGLRDSAFSMESGEDYVNVPESGESAEASLDGSREYVNVSQELHPVTRTKPATPSPEDEEDGAPDYENIQDLS